MECRQRSAPAQGRGNDRPRGRFAAVISWISTSRHRVAGRAGAARDPSAITLTDADPDTVLATHDVSAERDYDAFYAPLARAHDADVILTTDREFEWPCEDEPFDYLNAVLEEVLERFHRGNESRMDR